jgi:hypothetical protein
MRVRADEKMTVGDPSESMSLSTNVDGRTISPTIFTLTTRKGLPKVCSDFAFWFWVSV